MLLKENYILFKKITFSYYLNLILIEQLSIPAPEGLGPRLSEAPRGGAATRYHLTLPLSLSHTLPLIYCRLATRVKNTSVLHAAWIRTYAWSSLCFFHSDCVLVSLLFIGCWYYTHIYMHNSFLYFNPWEIDPNHRLFKNLILVNFPYLEGV